MFYNIDFDICDHDKTQRILNDLYGYKDDIANKVMHRNRLNRIFLMLEELIDHGFIKNLDSAIDIGCNTGIYSKILSDFGFKYVLGVDILDEYIEKANRAFGFKSENQVLEYRNSNAETILTKNKYDFVLCTEVLEHVKDPKRVIKNIGSILKPNGILLITMPNVLSIPYLLTYVVTYIIKNIEMDEFFKQHISYPFYKSLTLFDKTKFDTLKVYGVNMSFCDPFVKWSYKSSMFRYINRADFIISGLTPFKYFGHSICIVLRRKSN